MAQYLEIIPGVYPWIHLLRASGYEHVLYIGSLIGYLLVIYVDTSLVASLGYMNGDIYDTLVDSLLGSLLGSFLG